MKTALRFKRASGSARAKIETALRRGWQPGDKVRDFLRRQSRRNQSSAATAAGGGSW